MRVWPNRTNAVTLLICTSRLTSADHLSPMKLIRSIGHVTALLRHQFYFALQPFFVPVESKKRMKIKNEMKTSDDAL